MLQALPCQFHPAVNIKASSQLLPDSFIAFIL
jgi:hypothetical protein